MDLGPHKRPIPPPQLTPHMPIYSCWGKLEEFICCQLVLNLRLVFISASETALSAFHFCSDAESCVVWGVLENTRVSPSGSRWQIWAKPAYFIMTSSFILRHSPANFLLGFWITALLWYRTFIFLLSVFYGSWCWTCYQILTAWF